MNLRHFSKSIIALTFGLVSLTTACASRPFNEESEEGGAETEVFAMARNRAMFGWVKARSAFVFAAASKETLEHKCWYWATTEAQKRNDAPPTFNQVFKGATALTPVAITASDFNRYMDQRLQNKIGQFDERVKNAMEQARRCSKRCDTYGSTGCVADQELLTNEYNYRPFNGFNIPPRSERCRGMANGSIVAVGEPSCKQGFIPSACSGLPTETTDQKANKRSCIERNKPECVPSTRFMSDRDSCFQQEQTAARLKLEQLRTGCSEYWTRQANPENNSAERENIKSSEALLRQDLLNEMTRANTKGAVVLGAEIPSDESRLESYKEILRGIANSTFKQPTVCPSAAALQLR